MKKNEADSRMADGLIIKFDVNCLGNNEDKKTTHLKAFRQIGNNNEAWQVFKVT